MAYVIIFTFIIWAGIYERYLSKYYELTAVQLWGSVIVLEIIVIWVYLKIANRCPKCGKMGALHEIGRKNVETKDTLYRTTKHVNTGSSNSRTIEYNQPATEYTDKVYYKCKYCGFETEKFKTYRIDKY